jgi:hypothetical protein
MQRIERGEVHLWYCLVEDVVSQPKLIAACQRLLSQQEVAREPHTAEKDTCDG